MDRRRYGDEARRDRLREDRALFERYAAQPTSALREAIIERFLPLARGLALRYARTSSEPVDDLFQVAALGLVKAVDRYEAARGIAFSSYAVPTMAGEIKRHFRDRTWSIHVPRDLRDLTVAVQRERHRLQGRLERSPTVAEIAHALDVCDEDVLDALQAAQAHRAESLDAAPQSSRDPGDSIHELIGAVDPAIANAEIRATLDALLEVLPQRSRLLLRLRFDEDMTQREIGDVLGVSQMQVSRLLRESFDRLRHEALTDTDAASTLAVA